MIDTGIQISVRTEMLDGKRRHQLYKLKNATSLAGAAVEGQRRRGAATTTKKITAVIATTKTKKLV